MEQGNQTFSGRIGRAFWKSVRIGLLLITLVLVGLGVLFALSFVLILGSVVAGFLVNFNNQAIGYWLKPYQEGAEYYSQILHHGNSVAGFSGVTLLIYLAYASRHQLMALVSGVRGLLVKPLDWYRFAEKGAFAWLRKKSQEGGQTGAESDRSMNVETAAKPDDRSETWRLWRTAFIVSSSMMFAALSFLKAGELRGPSFEVFSQQLVKLEQEIEWMQALLWAAENGEETSPESNENPPPPPIRLEASSFFRTQHLPAAERVCDQAFEALTRIEKELERGGGFTPSSRRTMAKPKDAQTDDAQRGVAMKSLDSVWQSATSRMLEGIRLITRLPRIGDDATADWLKAGKGGSQAFDDLQAKLNEIIEFEEGNDAGDSKVGEIARKAWKDFEPESSAEKGMDQVVHVVDEIAKMNEDLYKAITGTPFERDQPVPPQRQLIFIPVPITERNVITTTSTTEVRNGTSTRREETIETFTLALVFDEDANRGFTQGVDPDSDQIDAIHQRIVALAKSRSPLSEVKVVVTGFANSKPFSGADSNEDDGESRKLNLKAAFLRAQEVREALVSRGWNGLDPAPSISLGRWTRSGAGPETWDDPIKGDPPDGAAAGDDSSSEGDSLPWNDGEIEALSEAMEKGREAFYELQANGFVDALINSEIPRESGSGEIAKDIRNALDRRVEIWVKTKAVVETAAPTPPTGPKP